MPLQQITLYNINFSSRFVLFTENTSIKVIILEDLGLSTRNNWLLQWIMADTTRLLWIAYFPHK
jgi:hypothetical protein